MSGKTYIDENGYERYRHNDKLVHRHIAEKKLGRKLKAGEVVHHKDRNKRNNSPGNLWVFSSQAEHDRIHKIDAYRHGKKASYKGFKRTKGTGGGGCMLLLLVIITFFMLFC